MLEMKKVNIVLNLKSSTSFKYLRFNSNSSNGGIFDWEFNFVHLLPTFERIKSRQRQQMQILHVKPVCWIEREEELKVFANVFQL